MTPSTILRSTRRPIINNATRLTASIGPQYRSLSTSPRVALNKKSIYVISIPVTTKKSYIYCNHTKTILDKTQLTKIPLLIRLETKVIGLAAKAWNKLNSSNMSVNKKIVEFVKKMLDTIPYEENCLKSFPSKSVMIREINEESVVGTEAKPLPPSQKALAATGEKTDSEVSSSKIAEEVPKRVLLQSQIEAKHITTDQLKPIPIYHPSFQDPTTILNQLHQFRNEARSLHLKYAGACALGIPITLPFALLPVVPNVPGLYLTYRLYCNIKALLGVKHLDYLLEKANSKKSTVLTAEKVAGTDDVDQEHLVQDTNHLSFQKTLFMDSIYKLGNTSKELQCESVQEEERVIITKEIIDALCTNLGLEQLKEDLLKALRQETTRLRKTMRTNNEIE